MQFKRLPNPKDRALLKGFLWGPDTIVVHDRAETVSYARHVAPLSVKATLRGAERYNVHGFFEEVRPGEHLVINAGQAYESEIDAEQPVESLCVFFSAQDVADASAAQSAVTPDAYASARIIEFPSVKRRSDARVEALLTVLPGLRGAPALQRQAHTLQLLTALIAEERSALNAVSLDVQRPGVRTELHRRCLIGKAYIDAHYSEDLSLTEIATAAGLSRAHFLRCFRRYFGITPHRALTARRLEEAAALLKRRRANVSQAALSVGYTDFSAFSRAFRRRFGVAPKSYAA